MVTCDIVNCSEPNFSAGLLELMRVPKKGEKGKVVLSKLVLILGLIGMTAFLIPAFITSFTSKSLIIPLAFIGFSLLGAYLVVAYLNCRIWYTDAGFTVKNFLGIKQNYQYSDITGIKMNVHEDILYFGNHHVTIDEFAVGNKKIH